MIPDSPPFWKSKKLSELSGEEWESLCDGCAWCCVHKFEDEDTGAYYLTNVACRLLDISTCRCTNYAERKKMVPDCTKLDPKVVRELSWLPPTCAYRLLAFGKELPEWHPLVTGDAESTHREGHSVRDRVLREQDVGELAEHIQFNAGPACNAGPTRDL